jgi:hypothetical protein
MKAEKGYAECTGAELVSILLDAPTGFNIAKHARILGRTKPAIVLVYRVAAGCKAAGSREAGKRWPKVEKIAKRLGWMQLGKR